MVKDVFGTPEEMNSTAEDAWEELKWTQCTDPEYFKKKEQDLGRAQVYAVDFENGEVVSSKIVNVA